MSGRFQGFEVSLFVRVAIVLEHGPNGIFGPEIAGVDEFISVQG